MIKIGKIDNIKEIRICNLNNRKWTIFFALFFPILIAGFMSVFNLIQWENSDDFTISQLLMGTSGEYTPYIMVSSVYLSKLIIRLQMWFPILNWLTVIETICVACSFVVFNYLIVKKSNNSILAVLFTVIFEPIWFVHLHYTRTAIITSFAGLLLIYDSCFSCDEFEQSKDKKSVCSALEKLPIIVKLIIGGIAIILGSLIRYSCIFLVIPFVGIFMLDNIVSNKCHKVTLKKLILFLIVSFVVYVMCFGLKKINDLEYDKWNELTNYNVTTSIKTRVLDYLPSDYSEDFYNSEANISYNDWTMMKSRITSDSYFSTDYYEKVHDVLQGIEDDDSSKSVVMANNLKQIITIRQGRSTGAYTQIFTFILFALLGIIINRKDRLFLSINIVITVGIIAYFLFKMRFPVWISDSVYFMATFVNYVYLSKEYSALCCEEKIWTIKKVILRVIFITCLILSFLNYKYAHSISWSKDNDVKNAIKYAEKMNDLILLDMCSYAPYPYIDVYGPFYGYDVGQWDNIMRVGNWDEDHPTRIKQMQEYGVNSIISSLALGKSYLLSVDGAPTFDIYINFFREHYGVNVYFELEKKFGYYGIYSCHIY